jgi:hypothetical protein
MHPRSTRTRPLIGMKRKKVYTNNILSPARLLLAEAFVSGSCCSSDVFFSDAVSCYKLREAAVCCCGIMLTSFHVEFWDGKSTDLRPVLNVVIHAPENWSPDLFLFYFEKVTLNSLVITLVHGYCIDGGDAFPYVTINSLHHYFKSK